MAKCDVRVIPLNPGEQSSAMRCVLLRAMNIQKEAGHTGALFHLPISSAPPVHLQSDPVHAIAGHNFIVGTLDCSCSKD